MPCNGMTTNSCSSGRSGCFWTLLILAAVIVWLNCGCSMNGGCGGCSGGCGCSG